ncbi:MAG: BON domain-containing protein [Bythopirellula sp.]
MIYSARTKSRAAINDRPPLKVVRPSHSANADTNAEADKSQLGLEQFDIELAERIITRIESRLPNRIRHLTVYTTDNAVVLTGECSTFYTKQIAQHTAMGVLDYERLINNIDVRVAK